MKIQFVTLLLFISISGLAQDVPEKPNYFRPTRNVIYFDVGRQALMSVQYERDIPLHRTSLFFAGHGGLGGILGSHDDTLSDGFPGHYTIFTGVMVLAGIRPVYLEAGLDPQVYFVEGTSFCNIDGNFGLRYQDFKRGNLFFRIGFSPILYTTHKNDFDVPFSFSLGEYF